MSCMENDMTGTKQNLITILKREPHLLKEIFRKYFIALTKNLCHHRKACLLGACPPHLPNSYQYNLYQIVNTIP